MSIVKVCVNNNVFTYLYITFASVLLSLSPSALRCASQINNSSKINKLFKALEYNEPSGIFRVLDSNDYSQVDSSAYKKLNLLLQEFKTEINKTFNENNKTLLHYIVW